MLSVEKKNREFKCVHLAFYGKSPKFSLSHSQYLSSYGKSKI